MGSFTVLDIQKDSITLKIMLLSGHQLHYHSHEFCDKVWTVMGGSGRIIVDGVEQKVKLGGVVSLSAGCKHTIITDSELRVIEVWLGEDTTVEDKIKHKK